MYQYGNAQMQMYNIKNILNSNVLCCLSYFWFCQMATQINPLHFYILIDALNLATIFVNEKNNADPKLAILQWMHEHSPIIHSRHKELGVYVVMILWGHLIYLVVWPQPFKILHNMICISNVFVTKRKMKLFLFFLHTTI